MNKKLDKIIHNRLFVIVLILVFICMTLLLGTYAWFTWGSTDNTTLTMTIGRTADVIFTSGNTIEGGLTPVFNYTDGLSTNFSITNRSLDNEDFYYDVKLVINSIDPELINEDVKYVLLKDDVILFEGDMRTAGDGVTILLYNGALSAGTSSYDFYLYMDGNEENDSSMIGKSISGYIVVEEGAGPYNLINYISNLYRNNYDSTKNIAFPDNTGMNYYAPSVSLMNDGLDSNGNMTNSPYMGNIRYYGTSPDNYIYFNCQDYSNQSADTCEVWRIIGIVDGKVKIMKNDSIGYYSWDYTSTGEYDNNWSDATLNTLLNGAYYQSGTTTYYNGDTTGETVSFETNGITSATRNNNLISSSSWYANGISDIDTYSSTLYKGERTGTSTSTGKIGLVYLSDYGYSVDLNSYMTVLGDNYVSSSWMMPFIDYETWFINPVADNSDYIWYSDWGTVSCWGDTSYFTGAVVPTLYLNPEIIINPESDGSSGNPYQIHVDVTPLSDFNYYLGSEYSTVDTISYYDAYTDAYYDVSLSAPIELNSNEVLLTKYIGISKNVNVPNTYTVNGFTYNVTMLSWAYIFYLDQGNDYEIDSDDGVFENNTNIEYVSLGNNIKFIANSENQIFEDDSRFLFNSCKNLVNVSEIPNSVTNMRGTFQGCTSLVNAPEIPSSVTNMNSTFIGCKSLTGTVRINSTNVSSAEYIFSNTSKNITVEVPAGSTTYTTLSSRTTTNGMPSNVTLSTFVKE